MSMLPLDIVSSYAIDFYALPIPTVDVVYNNVNGVDKQTILGARNIEAIADISNKRKLVQVFGGAVSDGDIGIITRDELFFVDAYALGSERKQSFVAYRGWQYRVLAVSDYTDIAGCFVYLGTRHITQDIV